MKLKFKMADEHGPCKNHDRKNFCDKFLDFEMEKKIRECVISIHTRSRTRKKKEIQNGR